MAKTTKHLRKDQFNDLLFGRKKPDEVVTWQLQKAFGVLREGYFMSQTAIQMDYYRQIFVAVQSVIWLANYLTYQEYLGESDHRGEPGDHQTGAGGSSD